MTSTRKGGLGGDLEICHVFTNSIVFKQFFYCLFLRVVGVWEGSLFMDFING